MPSRLLSSVRTPAAKAVATVFAAVAAGAAIAAPRQSALAPASDQAGGIALLWWVMLIVSTLVFLAVMAVLGVGLWRARGAKGSELTARASRNLVLVAGVAVPLVVLIALVGGSLFLGKDISTAPPAALRIEVTGWRWWWEVRYLDADGSVVATTANEIHIPVDRPVEFLLRSEDVIHSFWVPSLHGKTDLTPGRVNSSWLTARKPGVYRGQCAEFCGTQHALMGFLVIVQPEADFERWLAHQSAPAAAATDPVLARGEAAFIESGCADCHVVRGVTPPQLAAAPKATKKNSPFAGTSIERYALAARLDRSVPAPDLTHFGSRQTLAAAARPNTRGHLGGWIADPQGIKPGALMPPTLLQPDELTSLIGWLQSLK